MTAMPSIQIRIVDPTDPAVAAILDQMAATAPLSLGILFGGDRWRVVTVCAVARVPDGTPVGLATLAPTDEQGGGGPHLIGAWVAPAVRAQGIATALLGALIAESRARYGAYPTIVPVTHGGYRAAVRAASACAAAALAQVRPLIAPELGCWLP